MTYREKYRDDKATLEKDEPVVDGRHAPGHVSSRGETKTHTEEGSVRVEQQKTNWVGKGLLKGSAGELQEGLYRRESESEQQARRPGTEDRAGSRR